MTIPTGPGSYSASVIQSGHLLPLSGGGIRATTSRHEAEFGEVGPIERRRQTIFLAALESS
jgi:hypothetical protein